MDKIKVFRRQVISPVEGEATLWLCFAKLVRAWELIPGIRHIELKEMTMDINLIKMIINRIHIIHITHLINKIA